MRLFRKNYFIRRFTEQDLVNGLPCFNYQDFQTKLDVQPFNYYEKRAGMLKNEISGQRSIRYLKAYGQTELRQADQKNGLAGDWLFYRGNWYECKSAVYWNNTPLKHYRTEWVIVGEAEPTGNLVAPSVSS